MQFWVDLGMNPIVILSAVFIGVFGEIAKRLVSSKKLEEEVLSYRDSAKPRAKAPPLWKRIYYITLPAQAIIVGLLLGLVPGLPIAEPLQKEGMEFWGRLVTYGVAGVFCKVGYDTLISTAKRFVKKRAQEVLGDSGSSNSEPPSNPGV